ncbi:MAG: 30S ribosomal protein S20 [Acidobacteria bacterium]|nr:30S ribosomal protein S20 [Acidobacteriota bacterium]
MANHKSAEKRARQGLKRRLRNRHAKSQLRTAMKKMRTFVDENQIEEARTFLPELISLIQRKSDRGILHKNTASRYVSRMTQLVNKAAQN